VPLKLKSLCRLKRASIELSYRFAFQFIPELLSHDVEGSINSGCPVVRFYLSKRSSISSIFKQRLNLPRLIRMNGGQTSKRSPIEDGSREAKDNV
jgi:hypothetical protein